MTEDIAYTNLFLIDSAALYRILLHFRLQPPSLPPVPNSPGSIKQKRLGKRLLVVKELVDTERIFFNDVTITVEDIMNELIDRQVK